MTPLSWAGAVLGLALIGVLGLCRMAGQGLPTELGTGQCWHCGRPTESATGVCEACREGER